MCEARDAGSAVTAQYFKFGEAISGTSYFYNKDHLGSIRELTDGSDNILSQYNYSPYGQAMKFSENVPSDFQYASYYYHAPSGLNLTVNRAYSAQLGRWINRDPILEEGGLNLYEYVLNDPLNKNDPLGLQEATIIGCTGGPGGAAIGAAIDIAVAAGLAAAIGVTLADFVAHMGHNQLDPSTPLKHEIKDWEKMNPDKDPCDYIRDEIDEATKDKRRAGNNKCERKKAQERIDDLRRAAKAYDCKPHSGRN